jgi:alpha-glucoside transport system substrate-binding protein
VTAFGAFRDADEALFNETVSVFEEATGIDVQYESSDQFEATISVRVDAGDAPDIADFPQPGLMARFAQQGHLIDLGEFLPADYMSEQYIEGFLDMGSASGPDGNEIVAGVWERVNVKSLVWYPKEAFDAAGYEVPETWDELEALHQQIITDGDTPWCFGIESGVATGWPVTDWIEELMLRTASLDDYDAWTSGELPFASPQVQNAAEIMSETLLDDDDVHGGRNAIVSTAFGDAPAPMFEDPPRCWLHKQGNFIVSFFPEGLESGVDYDFFYLPPIDEQYGRPALIGGDVWSAFTDRPEVRAVLQWFSTAEHLRPWLEEGGTIAPQNDVNLDWYGRDIDRGVAEILAEATSVRFDGSDLMPGEVGAGSFWNQMTAYVSGQIDLDTALNEIDASWPSD